MIGWLSGRIIDRPETRKLVLETQGVGYDVETSLNTFFQIESQADNVGLHIHTVVREDALLLYGFLDKQERSLFRALIKVNGIGPKVAMGILSSATPSEFISCLQRGQLDQLTRLPGIGKKTAERLLLEMKDNLGQIQWKPLDITPTSHMQTEAISALEALGYKPNEALKMIKLVEAGYASCEELIRGALKYAVR
ncbi:MAG: Holliday junction branch migration protein RuvA [Gammaproteobacteria bacterium]|nr:Holliday junction branch migration protein RuvA [Gammaproteobacteria bacterium]